MDARAEAARETRDRILAATMELHARHGVVNVSHKDVAAAADVSVGTVYHHFPSRTELVQACGARSAEVLVAPPSAIDPQAPLAERIAALAAELVALHRGTPWIERIRAERETEPAIATALEAWQEPIDTLIRRALGPRLSKRRNAVAVVAAITDVSVVNRLSENGMSERDIAATLESVIDSWLEGGSHVHKRP